MYVVGLGVSVLLGWVLSSFHVRYIHMQATMQGAINPKPFPSFDKPTGCSLAAHVPHSR